MGLIRISENQYYNNDEFHGYYQFTKLDDVIRNFMTVYVGEDKVIPRVSKTDVRFHAMRAMQELSFDTFKSTKAQEIVLPPNLQMILPHDYVSYTKLSWVDTSGIKHKLYPTSDTSNPFSILQEEDGSYDFSNDTELVTDPGFNRSNGIIHPKWLRTKLNRIAKVSSADSKPGANPVGTYPAAGHKMIYAGGINMTLGKDAGGTISALNFTHVPQPIGYQGNVKYTSRILAAWHRVNVRSMDTIDLAATVNVTAASTTETNSDGTTATKPAGRVIISVQKNPGDTSYIFLDQKPRYPQSKNVHQETNAIGEFLKWNADDAGSDIGKSTVINVENHDVVYVLITSVMPFNENDDLGFSAVHTTRQGVVTGNTFTKTKADAYRNLVRQISVTNGISPLILQQRDNDTKDSTAWENYQGQSNSTGIDETSMNRNSFDNSGRYGLDPSRSNKNGSFYVDEQNGKINFSSDVSGKTIVLDYLSDSLGTDEEMQVHKFAEDALYKSIICDVLSTRVGVPEYAIKRYKQDKKAARRNAKLRLSNIKLEELAQTFRGKSKQIKH